MAVTTSILSLTSTVATTSKLYPHWYESPEFDLEWLKVMVLFGFGVRWHRS